MDSTLETKDTASSQPQTNEGAKMQEEELNYLREKLNQHLKFSHEHTHKVFIYIILLWGGTLILLGAKGNNMENIFMLFIIATIFFFSVVVLYFLGSRNFENLKAISKIGMYIAVFYEKRPNDKKGKKNFWELANFEEELKNIGQSDGKHNKQDKESNGEYFLFSIIAIVVIIAIVIKSLFLSDFFNKGSKICLCMDISDTIMISVCLLYIIISAILLFGIFKISFSSSKKIISAKKDYLKSFLNYAIKTKHYKEYEAKENLGDYIYNEISN